VFQAPTRWRVFVAPVCALAGNNEFALIDARGSALASDRAGAR
jgi:hypothetical protein